MKIALLLTGQLRSYDMVKYQINNNIISKYDTDIFLSIDLDNSLQCLNKNPKNNNTIADAKLAIEYFNPIDSFILNDFSIEFAKIKHNIDDISIINCSKILYRQYYIVDKAYKLLINHIKKTNKHYDIIIRLRFDQLIWTDDTFILDKLNNNNTNIIFDKTNCDLINTLSKDKKIIFNEVINNTIYLLGFGNFLHYKYANDQFWYHNMSLINNISNFYDNIPILINYCFQNNIGNKGALIECIFYNYLTNNNINLKQTNIQGIFLRILN